jgi:hypothetical protein
MRVALVVLLLAACSFNPGTGGASDAVGGGSDGPIRLDGVLTTDHVFAPDDGTLAILELNGDLTDSSGHLRDATLIDGTFVPTSWGQGLAVAGMATQGFQWSAYASLLVHPFTIELVVTPQSVACWHKLFSPNDLFDNGWYYCLQIQTCCPDAFVGGSTLPIDQRHYLAFVSTSATQSDVFYNGTRLGSVATGFTTPQAEAIFFRDDLTSLRGEAFIGVVDAVRISNVARTPAEIATVQARLATQP